MYCLHFHDLFASVHYHYLTWNNKSVSLPAAQDLLFLAEMEDAVKAYGSSGSREGAD